MFVMAVLEAQKNKSKESDIMIKQKKANVPAIISLICYIICIIVLLFEASMDGPSSSSQSNAVGGTLANFLNEIKGDQTVAIVATDLNIKNKITTANVGDKHTLTIENLPKDSTYQSVVYKSSNSNVASVSNEGVISFKNPGHVIIEAINEKYTSIKDSMEIDVKEVLATSFTASIENADINKDNIYTLYLSNEYAIKTSFEPENTTNKKVTYEYNKTYLEITEKGKIIPKKYSADQIIDIKVKHKDLSYTIKTYIDYKDIIKLEGYNITSSDSIYVSETYTPKITVNPSNSTFKDYTLISSNEDIIKINKNKSIIGLKEGKATLTIKSKYYESISISKEITVLPQPTLEGFTLSNTTLFIGDQLKLNYKKIPQYALNPTSITYESLNPNIATISNDGIIKGISEGVAKIRVTMNNQFTQVCNIDVKSLNITGNEDFTINPLVNNLSYGKEYNIKDILELTDWVPSDILNKDKISYALQDSSIGSIIDNKTIVLNKLGEHKLYVTHTLSGKTKSINLICGTYDFSVISQEEIMSSSSLFVNESKVFNIIDEEYEDINQYYEVTNENSEIISLTTLSSIDKRYEIKALNEGVAKIKITPYIDDSTDNNSYEIIINVSHIHSSYIDYSIINNSTKKEVLVENENLDVYINSSYSIIPIISKDATIFENKILSSNENVVTIDATGKMNFHSIGSSKITVLDQISKKEKSFTINIYNLINLNEETPFTLEGKDAEQLSEGKYAIRNGKSGKVKLNFTKNSTYKKVTYASSDPSVASIGADGTITPNKIGTTTITLICDDGMQKKIEINFELTIKRTDYIQNLDDFFYQVRKGVGHFSAFLILGIFSTLTWLLFLNNSKLFISIPINFATGFIMAIITEYIQTFVPGRYGTAKDVFLDYDGFLVSSVTLTVIFVIVAIIKGYRKYIKTR